jgi:hypothetical protein
LCTITASYEGKSNSFDVTIKNVPAVLDHVTITGDAQVNESSSAQYTLTAYYSDSSSTNVTSSASWEISKGSSYASISSGGELTTVAVTSDQSCIITAYYEGKSNSIGVTIKNVPPDYVVNSVEVSFSGSVAYTDTDIEITVTVSNNGGWPQNPPTYVTAILREFGNVGGYYEPLGTAEVSYGGIPPGESKTISWFETIPTGLNQNKYFVDAIVDYDHQERESNEDNNEYIAPEGDYFWIYPSTAPTVPTGLTVTQSYIYLGSMKIPSGWNVYWNPSSSDYGVSYYKVFRDGALLGTTSTTGYFDSNPTIGCWQVSAVGGNGEESDRCDEVCTGGSSPIIYIDDSITDFWQITGVPPEWCPSELRSVWEFKFDDTDGDASLSGGATVWINGMDVTSYSELYEGDGYSGIYHVERCGSDEDWHHDWDVVLYDAEGHNSNTLTITP